MRQNGALCGNGLRLAAEYVPWGSYDIRTKIRQLNQLTHDDYTLTNKYIII